MSKSKAQTEKERIHKKKMFNGFFNAVAYQTIFYVAVFCVLGGIWVFLIGFHNIDLSFNMIYRSYVQQDNFINEYGDLTSEDRVISYVDAYRLGIFQIMEGFVIGISGMWVLLLFSHLDQKSIKYYLKHKE